MGGCCFGANSKCSTDDQATCEKNARRGGCEWRVGDNPDLCAVPEPEPGCCYSAGGNSKCDTEDKAQCEPTSLSARVLTVDMHSNLVATDSTYILLIALFVAAALLVANRFLCVAGGGCAGTVWRRLSRANS